MNTPPDLDERIVLDTLGAGWGFEAVAVVYSAVGFGSHHWIATNAHGDRRFVTVDDLRTASRAASTQRWIV